MIDKSSDMTADQVIDKIGATPVRFGALYKIQCYNTVAHKNGDTTPSLTVYDYDRGYYCYSCGESGNHSWLLKKFGIEDERFKRNEFNRRQTKTAAPKAEVHKKDYTTYALGPIHEKLDGLTPEESSVLEAKGFTWQQWEGAGWRHHGGEIAGWPQGIFIPYFQDGELVSARLRNLNGNPRFLGLQGGESFAFQLDQMSNPSVFVCEGETDCMTLNLLGFPAVGIPGSTNASAIRKVIDRAVKNGTNLVVVPDNDEAGQSFLRRIREIAFDNFVSVDELIVPGYKDVNDWYCAVGQEQFEHAMHAIIGTSIFAPLPPKLEQGSLPL